MTRDVASSRCSYYSRNDLSSSSLIFFVSLIFKCMNFAYQRFIEKVLFSITKRVHDDDKINYQRI